MENWQVALIVVAAIYVGIRIPMMIQYQLTLRSVNKLIRDNEGDIRRTVIEVSRFTANMNLIGAKIEGAQVRELFAALGDLTEGIRRIRGTLRTASVVGAAVAPAVTAAIRAWQAPDGGVGLTDDAEEIDPSAAVELQASRNGIHQGGMTHGGS
jgi:hypothetical protein